MKTLNIIFAAMAAIVAMSCNKDASMTERKLPGHCEPISFKVDGVNVDLEKAEDALAPRRNANR